MPAEILNPSNQWSNKNEYYSTLMHLAELYKVTLPGRCNIAWVDWMCTFQSSQSQRTCSGLLLLTPVHSSTQHLSQ